MAGAKLGAIAATIQAICLGAGLRVATAESCTGGRVADALTDVPGSSGYVLGGVVTYDDAAKTRLLGVPASALAAHGAVSARVARLMAEGARARLGSDLAVAITGIAGPSGATAGKPVGLTYVAVADPRETRVSRHLWRGDREANKEASARAALRLLLRRARALAADATAGGSAPHT